MGAASDRNKLAYFGNSAWENAPCTAVWLHAKASTASALSCNLRVGTSCLRGAPRLNVKYKTWLEEYKK